MAEAPYLTGLVSGTTGVGGDSLLAACDANGLISPNRISPALLRTEWLVGDWKIHQFVLRHDYGDTPSVEVYKRKTCQTTISQPPPWEVVAPSRYTVEFGRDLVYIFCKFTPARDALKIVVRP